MRLFHENVTLEVDLDDDGLGNTIIIKYTTGVKQGGTLAPSPSPSPSPVLFLCYIPSHWQAPGIGDALSQLEVRGSGPQAAGIEKLMFRSIMMRQRAASVNGEMAVGSAPSWSNPAGRLS